MDYALLEKDGIALVKTLPKPFVEDLARLLTAYDMRALMPKLAILAPHVQAIMLEAFAGMGVDEVEIEKTIRNIVASVGITLPAEPPKAA
jgi:hypothetical protein